MAVHAYTSFSFSYLNRARVLASSLRRQHPDWVIWAVITDKEPEGFAFDLSKEDFDRAVTAEDLFGEITESWLFGHDVVEACTAVKGKALQHIMNEEGAEKILYFDPDIAVFNRMDPVIDLLDEYSIVLTPHQVDPEPADDRRAILDNEICSLDYGIFNLGFIAVRNDEEARRFAAWWADRLFEWCHDRLDIGVFVDQKWCNLVPCFFENVKILRDPGYNVASWNLSQREVAIPQSGEILVNGSLLRFFHFTKLGPTGDAMTQRYAADNVEVYELWWWYRNEVKRFTDAAIPKGWWYYGFFINGEQVLKTMRVMYRNESSIKMRFKYPYTVDSYGIYEYLINNNQQ